jgi:hypothetical protein
VQIGGVPALRHASASPPDPPTLSSPARSQLPPYGLAGPTFRFKALAMLAGRAPLGGVREVAMAVYLAARLAADATPFGALSSGIRSRRAGAARSWLATLTLPGSVRSPILRLIESSCSSALADGDGGADGALVLAALAAVIAATLAYLDAGARSELERLAEAFVS